MDFWELYHKVIMSHGVAHILLAYLDVIDPDKYLLMNHIVPQMINGYYYREILKAYDIRKYHQSDYVLVEKAFLEENT